MKDWKCCLGL